ncbi:integral membrane protein (DUF1751) [Abditibacterium utsteinense]|uniref:Integral membrane protein (DUF1751) n=1 Tax=Abditibacterium utsteinense TaxID=1960156 RepID=A0A2S8SQQ1_9BACT|nr:DUF1751 domain-containing protein [Abditibacterium utsteinense]PQV63134.1 integral membrane protein (DUF1751) [Abditibacterium utsteinense]
MRSDSWTNTQRSWLQTGFPFTIALMVLKFLSLFLGTAAPLAAFGSYLGFIAPDSLFRPWTFLTYAALSELPFLHFLFDIGLTYFFCSSIERAWGTSKFALFFGALTLTTSLSLFFGALGLRQVFVADALIPIAACGVAWGMLNAEEQVNLMFIPMRGIHMAAIAVCYIMFQYAQTNGWLGVPFSLLSCLLAFYWVRNSWQYGFGKLLPGVSRVAKRPNLRIVPPPKPKDDRFTPRDLNPSHWLKKRNERKKFEKLMRDD